MPSKFFLTPPISSPSSCSSARFTKKLTERKQIKKKSRLFLLYWSLVLLSYLAYLSPSPSLPLSLVFSLCLCLSVSWSRSTSRPHLRALRSRVIPWSVPWGIFGMWMVFPAMPVEYRQALTLGIWKPPNVGTHGPDLGLQKK